MKAVAGALALSTLLLAACGSSTASSSATTKASASATTAAGDSTAMAANEAFCANAKAIGSVSKGASSAMAMSPAESMKDWEALAAKVITLKAGAPADLVPAIDTVAARFTLEAKAQTMMAADATGGKDEMKMLDDHKAADDAALAKLVAGVKGTCQVDLS